MRDITIKINASEQVIKEIVECITDIHQYHTFFYRIEDVNKNNIDSYTTRDLKKELIDEIEELEKQKYLQTQKYKLKTEKTEEELLKKRQELSTLIDI